MFGHENLSSLYSMNFQLKKRHGFGLGELGEMLPFEREIYVSLLIKHLKEEKERIANAKRSKRK